MRKVREREGPRTERKRKRKGERKREGKERKREFHNSFAYTFSSSVVQGGGEGVKEQKKDLSGKKESAKVRSHDMCHDEMYSLTFVFVFFCRAARLPAKLLKVPKLNSLSLFLSLSLSLSSAYLFPQQV